MENWSNISVSPQDPEIIRINQLEARLGQLPEKVYKIRNLITRHEVCHFKYQQHIQKIKDSIMILEPAVDPDQIGLHHIHHGEEAWIDDATGRSLLGQQYIWAIREWLNETPGLEFPEMYDKDLEQKIQGWLGKKNPDKIRLVQLLLARLTWDFEPYRELQPGSKYYNLELNICSIDICHYAFPANLDEVLRGIGDMRSIEKLKGCGSFNEKIQKIIEKELISLDNWFKSLYFCNDSDRNDLIKAWLIVCLIKTLKEQAGLKNPEIHLER